MRSILKSLFIITVISIVAVAATQAFFSDTETSSGNTFTAGTLDLAVDGENGTVTKHITIENLEPGYASPKDGYGIPTGNFSWVLKNVGRIEGEVWAEFANVANDDNGCTEPEGDSGDSTCDDNQGELGQHMLVAYTKSTSNIHRWASGFHTFNSDVSSPWNIIGTGGLWPESGPVTLAQDEEIRLGLKFKLPNTVGNVGQSDGLEFDIIFHLDQLVP